MHDRPLVRLIRFVFKWSLCDDAHRMNLLLIGLLIAIKFRDACGTMVGRRIEYNAAAAAAALRWQNRMNITVCTMKRTLCANLTWIKCEEFDNSRHQCTIHQYKQQYGLLSSHLLSGQIQTRVEWYYWHVFFFFFFFLVSPYKF